uniref:Uncharacterized protein n=1 Tax=Mustela putorius furo TaxID=9669 RepID=M3Z1N0_MUSPF
SDRRPHPALDPTFLGSHRLWERVTSKRPEGSRRLRPSGPEAGKASSPKGSPSQKQTLFLERMR